VSGAVFDYKAIAERARALGIRPIYETAEQKKTEPAPKVTRPEPPEGEPFPWFDGAYDKPLWQLAGLKNDPGGFFDVTITTGLPFEYDYNG
jgi:hypothetical protein